ncbi:tetratricopeptide repeat protein [Christiangramia portivictoriae]|uniref:tetratricopeptide repeat protein n=1 Tax=Christiangramia portivictoriae TaxID=326069 RepID=UPI0012F7FD99|nr:tetratricopeptide repeat protein [Christiangramia portivictoriae]
MRFLLTLTLTVIVLLPAYAQQDILNNADSLAAVGNREEAIKLLTDLPDKDAKILLKLAKFQQSEGNIKSALENYKQVTQKHPEKVLTMQDYGELLLENGKLELADSIFSNLKERYPENAGFTYRLGLVKEKRKLDTLANRLFFETVSYDFSHQGALYKTSKYQLARGRKHEAIELAKSGLKKRPKNVSLLSILGQAYMSTFQFDKAIPAFKTIVEEGEASEFVLENLARAYRMTNQLAEALETYRKMLDINDMNSAAHSNIGVILMEMNRHKEAREHFYNALFIKNPRVDKEFLNLGLASKELEDFKEAYRFFKFAIEENEENERALLELALTADRYFKDKKSVIEHYERYLDKYSGNGNSNMIEIAKYRLSELKKEVHFSG